VHYSPLPPWPTGAEGTGKSLQRIRSEHFADDPANWRVAEPTAGLPNGDLDPDEDKDGLPNDWEAEQGLDPRNGAGDNGTDGDPITTGSPTSRSTSPAPGRAMPAAT
jgi:hypothetical protein